MIIKGGSRKSGAFFSKHLMNAEENARVEVKEMRGFTSHTVPMAFTEMEIIAAGTRCENYFYHVSMNPREHETLTPEQWNMAVDTLETNLGLDGHSRFQIEHEKAGRTHRHVVWNRIDPDTMTASSDSFTYQAHDKTRRALEAVFEHEPTPETPQPSERKSREVKDWENFRAQESGLDPKAIKVEVTALWQVSDSGAAFKDAVEEAGYTLCKGDRRDFCLVDSYGDVHSLARRIEGAKAADIRQRMADIDPLTLPSVKDASKFVRQSRESSERPEASSEEKNAAKEDDPPQWVNPKLRILEKFAHDHPATAPPVTYHPMTSAQAFTDTQVVLLQQRPFSRVVTDSESSRLAWEALNPPVTEVVEKVQDKHSELWQGLIGQLPERQPETHEPELER